MRKIVQTVYWQPTLTPVQIQLGTSSCKYAVKFFDAFFHQNDTKLSNLKKKIHIHDLYAFIATSAKNSLKYNNISYRIYQFLSLLFCCVLCADALRCEYQ